MKNIKVVSLKAATLIGFATSSVVMGFVYPQVAQASSPTAALTTQTDLFILSSESLQLPKGYTPPNNGKPKNGRGAGTRT